MTHNTMLATALTALLIPSAPTAEAKPRADAQEAPQA